MRDLYFTEKCTGEDQTSLTLIQTINRKLLTSTTILEVNAFLELFVVTMLQAKNSALC